MAEFDFNQFLKLDRFQTGFFKCMNEFRIQNLFCDVTLDVDGTLFPCHRLVLIAASPYFKTMFNGNFKESTSNIVPLKEVEPEAIEEILDTIYSAIIQLRPDNVYSVLRASHLLQLDTIVDTCANCIIKNPRIHYLIDTCIFAGRIGLGQRKLYDACIQEIADDFLHWGRTDSFVQLSSVDLNSILQKGNYDSIKDEVLMLILRWSKSNPASTTPKKIQELLESAKLWNQIVGATVLAQFIVTGESDLVKSFVETVEGNKDHKDADFCLNLYVNTVDVKSGARGLGLIKTDDSFQKHSTFSIFHKTQNTVRAICEVEKRTYLLEKDYAGNYAFIGYNDYKKTVLKMPPDCVPGSLVSMTAMENTVYLVSNQSSSSAIWTYNHVRNEWVETTVRNASGYYSNQKRHALHGLRDCSILTTLDQVLYMIGTEHNGFRCKYIVSFDSRSPSVRKSIEYPSSFAYGNYSACSFDGKIAIAAAGLHSDNVRRKTFSIYDVRANKFLDGIKQMNTNQENPHLIHCRGHILAVSNSLLEKDENYYFFLNKWTELRHSLPKRVKTTDGDAVVATGTVIAVNNC